MKDELRGLLSERVRRLLDVADDELDTRWAVVCRWAEQRFDVAASTEALLFLIGVSEEGGIRGTPGKEHKQAIVYSGVRAALRAAQLVGSGEDPPEHPDSPLSWKNLSEIDQEKLLRIAILAYFDKTDGS